jgi:hypothetical protein
MRCLLSGLLVFIACAAVAQDAGERSVGVWNLTHRNLS